MVVINGRFQQPSQGIPYPLIRSFVLIVAFVCSVPLLLDEIYLFYKSAVYEDKVGSLTLDPEIRYKYEQLKSTGSAAERSLRSARRILISSTHPTKEEDPVKFFTSVGAKCMATQMICNLITDPICNNTNIAKMYQAYVATQVSINKP